jgi:hypothetical protein
MFFKKFENKFTPYFLKVNKALFLRYFCATFSPEGD